MRIIVICNGANWQEDYMGVYDKARRYFENKFYDWREKDEAVQEALCFLLKDFMERWEHGKEVVFTPLWCASPVWHGRTFVKACQRGGRGYRKPERQAMPSDVAAKDAALDWELDFKAAMEKLTQEEQRIVKGFMEGYTAKEIGVKRSEISEALKKLHSLL